MTTDTWIWECCWPYVFLCRDAFLDCVLHGQIVERHCIISTSVLGSISDYMARPLHKYSQLVTRIVLFFPPYLLRGGVGGVPLNWLERGGREDGGKEGERGREGWGGLLHFTLGAMS